MVTENRDRCWGIKIEGWEMLRNIERNARNGEKKGSQKVHTQTEKEERLLTFTGKPNHCILFQNPQAFRLQAHYESRHDTDNVLFASLLSPRLFFSPVVKPTSAHVTNATLCTVFFETRKTDSQKNLRGFCRRNERIKKQHVCNILYKSE